MNKLSKSRRWIALCGLALVLLLFTTAWAQNTAQPVVTASESELSFNGLTGESLQRAFTLTVTGGKVEGIEVTLQEPRNTDQAGGYIPLDKLVVDPKTLIELSGQQDFTLTMTGYDQPGTYEGKLTILFSAPPEQPTVEIALKVVLRSTPQVEATAGSVNSTLPTDPGFWGLPFLTPSAGPGSPLIGQTTLTLVQKAEGPALIKSAEAVDFAAGGNIKLPKGTVTVLQDEPIALEQIGQQADLAVEVRGQNLRAGEYSGTVQVIVEDQSTLLEIPLKIQVKVARLAPLLVTLFGLAAALILPWWRNHGMAMLKISRSIDEIQKILDKGEYLSRNIRSQAAEDLEKARQRVMAGETGQAFVDELEALKKGLETSQAEAKQFSDTEVKTLEDGLQKITIAAAYRNLLSDDIQAFKEAIRIGDFNNVPQLKLDIVDLKSRLDALGRVAEAYAGMAPADQAAISAEMETTVDMSRLQELVGMQRGGPVIFAQPYSVQLTEFPRWVWFKIKLQTGKILAYFLVISFTLAVGWFTLYESNATFGAQSSDYINLILWISAVNIAGLASMDLKSIYTSITTPQV